MKNLVEINNTELGIKEYNGQRVITFKDIDRVHNRAEGTARNAFNRNRKRLVQNEDYFIITPKILENSQLHTKRSIKEKQMDEFCTSGIAQVSPRGTTFVTESGYLMITKVFDDDLSWQVQRQLVNTYFKVKEIANTISDTSQITSAITTLAETMNVLVSNITSMQQDISELKQSQRNRYLLENRYPSAWYKKMSPKYNLLQEYFDCTRKELYSSIYKELEDTYDVDINQIHEDYCYENHLLKDECYPMDAIEHDTRLRDALTLLVDSSLVKFGLKTEDEISHFKRETLFDREPIVKKVV